MVGFILAITAFIELALAFVRKPEDLWIQEGDILDDFSMYHFTNPLILGYIAKRVGIPIDIVLFGGANLVFLWELLIDWLCGKKLQLQVAIPSWLRPVFQYWLHGSRYYRVGDPRGVSRLDMLLGWAALIVVILVP